MTMSVEETAWHAEMERRYHEERALIKRVGRMRAHLILRGKHEWFEGLCAALDDRIQHADPIDEDVA